MLYIHVPFCKKRCIYCDFYSTTYAADVRSDYVDALCREMEERSTYLCTDKLQTVYLGGGTPSQLSADELRRVFAQIRSTFKLSPDAEITIEANPDDITPLWVETVRALGVNRVSLGVQSFDDRLLRLINRRHNAARAAEAVQIIRDGGITNISIDLIYGLPGQSVSDFRQDLNKAFSLPITHLSSYALSVEEGTALAGYLSKGDLTLPPEDTVCAEYEWLMAEADANGFEHYEISNFARPGCHSKHNSRYWDGTPYLGLGPGAHSFDGKTRRYNLPDVRAYIRANGNAPHETEVLTRTEQEDEMIFTALRTRRGLRLDDFSNRFGQTALDRLMSCAAPHIAANRLSKDGNTLRLNKSSIFVSDDVISDLMNVD